MSRVGVLLLNLGTPSNDTSTAVYCYLSQFLNDPRVINLPKILRWVLANFIIIPFRYKKTTAAYRKIWTPNGSPLLLHTIALKEIVQSQLGEGYKVAIGMRYGTPTIASGLEELKDCSLLKIIPLFPQYSSAATGSAVEKTLDLIKKNWNIPTLFIQKDFYNHPKFIASIADIIKKTIEKKNIEKIIFSYHGLPESHIHKGECNRDCYRDYCYRAQCYETTRLVASVLELSPSEYTVSFQSRLGRTPWIKPFTDVVLKDLREEGVKNIAIVCPSFVVDCLETLEEINIQAREQWQMLGGNDFVYIPCVNQHPGWVEMLSELIT